METKNIPANYPLSVGKLFSYQIMPLPEKLVAFMNANPKYIEIFQKACNWDDVQSTDAMAAKRLELIFQLLMDISDLITPNTEEIATAWDRLRYALSEAKNVIDNAPTSEREYNGYSIIAKIEAIVNAALID